MAGKVKKGATCPLWEPINLTGIYDWIREPQPEGTFRSLRIAREKFMAAA